MSKFNNPTKVITGSETRWSYANVWDAKSINGGAPNFSVSLIIPKSDTKTVEKIKAAIQAAYEEGQSKLKETVRVYRHSLLSKRLSVMVTRKDRTIRLMRDVTLSMPTVLLLLVSWMQTVSRFLTVPKFTVVCMEELLSAYMHSTATETAESPVVSTISRRLKMENL